MELNTPSRAFSKKGLDCKILLSSKQRVYLETSHCQCLYLVIFSLCPAMCLPSSVSPLFLCCNRPFVFQLPVVVGVSAVQFRVVQKVTRVQPSYVQDSSYRDTARLQMRACVTLSEIRNYPDRTLLSHPPGEAWCILGVLRLQDGNCRLHASRNRSFTLI